MTEPVARTVNGYCKTYGRSRATAYRHLKAGKLKAVKDGRSTLILEESAIALKESLPVYKPVHKLK